MFPLTRASRANGPQLRSQSAPLGNRRSPQSALRTVHAMFSRIATRQFRPIRAVQPTGDKPSGVSGLIASPAPVLARRSSTRGSGLPVAPNHHNPISGHHNPPLWHPSSADARTIAGRPTLISIASNSHNTKKDPLHPSASASNPSLPQPCGTKRSQSHFRTPPQSASPAPVFRRRPHRHWPALP